MQLKCLIFLFSLWKSAQNMPHLDLEETYFYSPIYLVLGYSPYNPYYQLFSYNLNYIKNQQTTPMLENKMKDEKTGFTIAQGQYLISLDFRPRPNTEFGKPSTDSPGSVSTPKLTPEPSISLNYQTTKPKTNMGQIQPDKPNSPETYFSQAKTPGASTDSIAQTKPSISLEYQEMKPSSLPKPGNNIDQIIAPGKPSPDGYDNDNQSIPNIIDRLSENSTVQLTEKPIDKIVKTQRKPTISLEYKPMRPFYAGTNGFSIGQIVQPGQPWPSSPEGYQTFSQTTTPKLPVTVSKPNLDNRVKEPTTDNKTAQEETINIEYKPMRPFFAGETGFSVGQIVQPGLPWPANAEDYQNFSQTTKLPITSPKPNLDNRVQEPTVENNGTIQEETINIEYKPMRPFFAGETGFSVGQIVPPGLPWPASEEDYQNFSQTSVKPNLDNRVQETLSGNNKTAQGESVNIPMRPFFAGSSGFSVGQIVPPGKPWPGSAEDYQNFTQTSANPNLGNRVQEMTPSSSNQAAQEQVISLEYKPMRPFHYPKPTTVGQVVSTGKPWPVSLEGYQNFTEGKPSVVEDRFQESSTSEAQAGFIWEEDVITQPRHDNVLYTSKPGQEGAITTEGALYTSSILDAKAVSEAGLLGKQETLNVSALPLKMPFISVAASNDE